MMRFWNARVKLQEHSGLVAVVHAHEGGLRAAQPLVAVSCKGGAHQRVLHVQSDSELHANSELPANPECPRSTTYADR